MKLRILASAKADLEEGYRFYEAQNAGLGEYFITSVAADIESLRLYAGIHPVMYKDFHRSLCRIFPFAIYYLKVAARRHHLRSGGLPARPGMDSPPSTEERRANAGNTNSLINQLPAT
jgi:hypothetical protein